MTFFATPVEQTSRLLPTGVLARRWFLCKKLDLRKHVPPGEDARRERQGLLLYACTGMIRLAAAFNRT